MFYRIRRSLEREREREREIDRALVNCVQSV